MRCEDCGCTCECEEDELEPFIGPINAPTEGPPTLEQHLANQIGLAMFGCAQDGTSRTLTGLAAALDAPAYAYGSK